MKNSFLKKVFLVSFIIPYVAYGQAFQVNLQGQKQQAMGSAGTAFAQDAAILFYNPGGMVFIEEKNSILFSGNATLSNSAFQDELTKQVSRTNSPIGTPFSMYTIFNLKNFNKLDTVSNLKFGIGIYTPFGSSIRWEDGWSGRFALTSIKLKAIFFQPTLSYRFTENFGIGAGLVYSDGSVELKKDIPVQDAQGNYGKASLKGKANGFGFNIGLYFCPAKKVSIGISYRSRVQMQVKSGEASFEVPSSLSQNFPNGKFSSSLPLPSIFTLGLAVKANEKVNLTFDVNYGGWNAYKALEFDYENNTSSLKDTYSERNYKNNFAFRFGFQYKKDDKTFYRFGAGYVLSPVPDGYVTPETPDANRVNLTCGYGYNISKKFCLDASLTFAQPGRKDKNIETQLEGTYRTIVFIPGISLLYSF